MFMAKTVNYPTPRGQTTTISLRNYVFRSFTERVKSWTPLTLKLMTAYALWIVGSFAVYESAGIVYLQHIAAIGFWFGWLAVLATVLFVAGMLVTGILHDVRHPILTRYVRSRDS
jgi:hypothetical protein